MIFLKNLLKNRIFKEEYNPSIIGCFTNPFFISRFGLHKYIKKISQKVDGPILDVGCGQKPYELLFGTKKYIGMEYSETSNKKHTYADLFYENDRFPIDSGAYNSVVCFQVLEHTKNPDSILEEINRVLIMNGSLLITAPFVWDLHEKPHDYFRFTSFGFQKILQKGGFEIVESYKTANDLSFHIQLLILSLHKHIFTKYYFFNLLLSAVIFGPLNILSLLLKILPKNDDLYLDNVILAKKIKTNF